MSGECKTYTVCCPICGELRRERRPGNDTPCQRCTEEEPDHYEAWEREHYGEED